MLLRDRKVRRREVAAYLGDAFRSALRLYRRWLLFGLPGGAGWASEPETTLQIIELFEQERHLYEQEKKAERQPPRGSEPV